MSIAPISTNRVELRRVRVRKFVLTVGCNTVRLRTPAIEDLLALLTLDDYADGSMGVVVHSNRDYRANPDAPTATLLVAIIGTYDASNRSLPAHAREGSAGPDAHRPAAPDYQWTPNNLHLALTTCGQTCTATLTRSEALGVLNSAPRRTLLGALLAYGRKAYAAVNPQRSDLRIDTDTRGRSDAR